MTTVHEQVAELLPWFVNGTLPAAEREAVQRHVSECLPCRRDLHDELKMHATVGSLQPPDRESAGLDRLLRAIAREDSHSGVAARIAHALSAGAAQRTAGVAAACATVLIGGYWIVHTADRGPSIAPDAGGAPFSTLTAPGRDRPSIDLVFTAPTREADIAAFAAALGATIVAGPSDAGRYTLTLPPDSDVDAVIARARSAPTIRFAGRTFIGGDTQ